MNKYTSIHTHTYFSYLDALISPKDLVQKGKELGYPAVCTSDHGNCSAHIEAYKEAQKAKIKYIPGCEFYFTEKHEDKSRKSNHLTVIAKNNAGLSNMYKMLTIANTPVDQDGGFYFKPRISFRELEKYNEGIIILTGCMASIINRAFIEKGYDEGHRYAIKFLDIFGRDRLFVEIQNVNDTENPSEFDKIYIPEQLVILQHSRKLAKDLNIKPVATSDSHWLNKFEDEFAHEVLKAVEARATLDTPIAHDGERGRLVYKGHDYYIRSADEMREKFTEEEVSNSSFIAEQCDVSILLKQKHMPKFDKNINLSQAYELLVEKCREGWLKLKINHLVNKDIYTERIKIELADIKEADLQDYFLIVWDICKFMDDNKIGRNFSRGSAAGSLVSYLLGITKLDPIKYKLIWERFWNRGRKGSPPDVDLDVSIERREEVIEYIREKYGKDKVFPMMTISTMTAKQAIKDVGKVLGLSFDYMNDFTKDWPVIHGKCMSIKEASQTIDYIKMAAKGIDNDIINWHSKLKNLDKEKNAAEISDLENQINTRTKQLLKMFEISKKLEDIPRQRSSHACALLIADEDIFGKVPLIWDTSNKRLITGFDMYNLEDLGYLKLDILGLKTVSVVEKIVPEGIDYIIKNSPEFDDPKVYQMICNGYTKGVFQLETSLGKSWAMKLQPKNIQELSDLISLIRPAVLDTGLSSKYIENKLNPDEIEYIHEDLRPIFEKTYGIMCYQEQMLEVAKKFAGFDLAQADLLRKATGKKLPEEMAKYKDLFVNGCKNNKYSEEVAQKLWEWVEAGASYSFNLAHSMAYAMMAYTTAYLKCHFAEKFFCAMFQLSNNGQNPLEEIAELFYDSKIFKVNVNPPSLKEGNYDFSLINNEIYYGLSHIKHIGESSIKKLKGLKINDWNNILTNRASIKKDVLHALILSGALDYLGISRYEMITQIEFLEGLTDREIDLFNIIVSGGLYEDKGKKINFDKSTDFQEGVIKLKSFLDVENQDLKIINKRRVETLLGIYKTIIDKFNNNKDLSPAAKATFEAYYLGIAITCSEVDSYNDNRKTHHCIEIQHEIEGRKISVIAILKNIKRTTDKNGREMAFISVADKSYLTDAILFNSVYSKYKDKLIENNVYFISGTKRKNSLIVDYIEAL